MYGITSSVGEPIADRRIVQVVHDMRVSKASSLGI